MCCGAVIHQFGTASICSNLCELIAKASDGEMVLCDSRRSKNPSFQLVQCEKGAEVWMIHIATKRCL